MATEKIYVWREQCTQKGQVWTGPDRCADASFDPDECDDITLYGEGTPEELIAAALASLATRYDHRAGGAGDSFRWKCDLAVLEYLNGPEMEFNRGRMVYLPVAEVQEDLQ